MASLVYRALDAHIIAGLADEPAFQDDDGSLSYAELLAEVAALAGGLRQLGIGNQTPIMLELTGRAEAIAVLACARLGAVPSEVAHSRLSGDEPRAQVAGEQLSWSQLLVVGKADPVAAAAADEPGYAEQLMARYPALFTELLAGRTAR